jgi:hypothetical protein
MHRSILRIARGQQLSSAGPAAQELARKAAPEDNLNWRTWLKEFHAAQVAQIMAANGYQSEDTARVGSRLSARSA